MKTRLCYLVLGLMLTGQTVLAQDVLIRNSTVLTITKGTLTNTDVLIQDGIIAEIGSNIRAPRGIEEVDGTGKFLMPGIIDAQLLYKTNISVLIEKRKVSHEREGFHLQDPRG